MGGDDGDLTVPEDACRHSHYIVPDLILCLVQEGFSCFVSFLVESGGHCALGDRNGDQSVEEMSGDCSGALTF